MNIVINIMQNMSILLNVQNNIDILYYLSPTACCLLPIDCLFIALACLFDIQGNSLPTEQASRRFSEDAAPSPSRRVSAAPPAHEEENPSYSPQKGAPQWNRQGNIITHRALFNTFY